MPAIFKKKTFAYEVTHFHTTNCKACGHEPYSAKGPSVTELVQHNKFDTD